MLVQKLPQLLRISLCAWVLACQESSSIDKTSGTNTVPTVVITSHTDGSVFEAGQTVVFRAQADDENHDALELTMAWYTGTVEGLTSQCIGTAVDESGEQACAIELTAGMSSIVAEVQDPTSATGIFSLAIDVTVNQPPTSMIEAPLEGTVVYANQEIVLSGRVLDADHDLSDVSVEWRSDLAGSLFTGVPDEDGLVVATVELSEGVHTLELVAEDAAGATSSDTVLLEVGPENQPPLCSIVSPINNAQIEEGNSVLFQATMSDPNIPSTQLSVQWSSDQDGVFGPTTASNDGEMAFEYDGLSVGAHTVALEVLDEMGLSCSVQRQLIVGNRPTVNIDAPSPSTVWTLGDVATLIGTVSDVEDAPENLLIEWHSDQDGLLYAGSPDTQGQTLVQVQLSAGMHTLTLQTTDNDGFTQETSRIVEVNTPPSAPTVSISPMTPTSTDDLVVSIAQPTDVDGDVVSHTIEWLKGANFSTTANTGTTLLASATAVGEYWTVRVTPNDGHTDGNSAQSTVLIQNTPPSVSNVSLAPNPVYTGDVLTCTAQAMDVDDGALQPLFDWSVNGMPVGTGATWTVSGLLTNVGDVITCTATAQDAQLSVATDSVSTVVVNSAPTIVNPQIDCAQGAYNDQMCTCSATVVDPDETVIPTYQWMDVSGVLSISTTFDLSTTSLLPEDSFTCQVSAVDEHGATETTSLDQTVLNRPPEIQEISVVPSEPIPLVDDVHCQATSISDPDGQPVTTLSYVWSSNLGGSATGSVLSASQILDLEVWTCTVTISDGMVSAIATEQVQAVSTQLPPVTFTSCGISGTLGPAQADCDAAYLGSDLEGAVTVVNGAQQWIAPYSGLYTIEAFGAKGGDKGTASGGSGAFLSAEFMLSAGDVLNIVVGQPGVTGVTATEGGGGGGATFVFDEFLNPLLIAGGGGGASHQQNAGYGGSTTSSSVGGGYGQSASGDGGLTGNSIVGAGAGGGGLYSVGASNDWCDGGGVLGGAGGVSLIGIDGGFGGGAGGYYGGGGAGGYTGGSGGTPSMGGGGGGSYSTGNNLTAYPNYNADSGKVIISK